MEGRGRRREGGREGREVERTRRASGCLVMQVAVNRGRRARRLDADAEVAAADAAVDVLSLQSLPSSTTTTTTEFSSAHVDVHGDFVEGLGPTVAPTAPAVVADEVAVGGTALLLWFGVGAEWNRGFLG